MPVYKRGAVWYYDFRIEGVRFRGSTGEHTRGAALAVEAEKRTHAQQNALIPGRERDMTINQALDRYWTEHAQNLKSADTIFYQLAELLALGKHKRLVDVTAADVSRYVAQRRGATGRRSKRQIKPSSINRELQILRAIFNRAADQWGVDIPARINWRQLRLREAAPRTRYLTAEEETALFTHLRQDFRPMVAFCLLTGARVASVLRLTWNDVDYHAGTVRLREMKSRHTGEAHTIPLTPALTALLAEQKGLHAIYVFTYVCQKASAKNRRKGARYPFSKQGWKKGWEKALEGAGIQDLRFHDLRHTAATRLLQVTGNLAVVRELLGHADISTTSRYAHVLKDDVRAGLMAVSNTFGHTSGHTAQNGTGNTLNKKDNSA